MKTSSHNARSIRYAGVALMIAAVSAVQACSSDTTLTAPSSIARGPAAARAQIRISGTVTDDDGAPVGGVTVSARGMFFVVTDNTGFYSVSTLSGLEIVALTTKEGYVSGWHSHSTGRADLQWDLRIYRMPKAAGN